MSEAKCPVAHGANSNMEKSPTGWWPKILNLDILHQHDQKTRPFNGTYNYREEVKKHIYLLWQFLPMTELTLEPVHQLDS